MPSADRVCDFLFFRRLTVSPIYLFRNYRVRCCQPFFRHCSISLHSTIGIQLNGEKNVGKLIRLIHHICGETNAFCMFLCHTLVTLCVRWKDEMVLEHESVIAQRSQPIPRSNVNRKSKQQQICFSCSQLAGFSCVRDTIGSLSTVDNQPSSSSECVNEWNMCHEKSDGMCFFLSQFSSFHRKLFTI